MCGLEIQKGLQGEECSGTKGRTARPLSPRVRSLDIDNDVAPRDLSSHSIVPSEASHRTLHWLGTHLLTGLTSVQPPFEVLHHAFPVAKAPDNLKRLACRTVGVHKSQVRELEGPSAPTFTRLQARDAIVWHDGYPIPSICKKDPPFQHVIQRVEPVLLELLSQPSFASVLLAEHAARR